MLKLFSFLPKAQGPGHFDLVAVQWQGLSWSTPVSVSRAGVLVLLIGSGVDHASRVLIIIAQYFAKEVRAAMQFRRLTQSLHPHLLPGLYLITKLATGS